LVLQYILPKLSTILKVRSKKLNEGSHILGEMSSENNELGTIYDNILTKSLKESDRLLQNSNNGAFSWVESSSHKNISDLQKINSFYLKSIGNIYAKRGLLRNIVSH